jgi:hypothetical protein
MIASIQSRGEALGMELTLGSTAVRMFPQVSIKRIDGWGDITRATDDSESPGGLPQKAILIVLKKLIQMKFIEFLGHWDIFELTRQNCDFLISMLDCQKTSSKISQASPDQQQKDQDDF